MAETAADLPPIVALTAVSVARSGQLVLQHLNLRIAAGARVFIGGENGAGKSSLLMLLAGRLHPYNNSGSRSYAWDGAVGEDFRSTQKHVTLVSRDEQNRLQNLHATSTVAEFLRGHLAGQDFLYRQELPTDREQVTQAMESFGLMPLVKRKLKTLSLGEMRLSLIARADLHPRRLYLLDEIFSGLSATPAERVSLWIKNLPRDAAVVLTGHDAFRVAHFSYTDRYIVEGGKIIPASHEKSAEQVISAIKNQSPPFAGLDLTGDVVIAAKSCDFYHDFIRIFENMSFQLKVGQRILLTGPNGSGKTTLLRVMHGDFYPAWQKGTLQFLGPLAHEQKRSLWAQVQFIAASHFSYYPARMSVQEVLASRYSGSIYEYPAELASEAGPVLQEFDLELFLSRPFIGLSEGEKTRTLLARAFLLPAPVYLIDEGFIALSERYFAAAVRYLNRLPQSSTIVIAANERVAELKEQLSFPLAAWQLEGGRLHEM